jgi:hypothetical protein
MVMVVAAVSVVTEAAGAVFQCCNIVFPRRSVSKTETCRTCD